jgi:hypothetical protein
VIERKQLRADRMPQREIAANAFRGFSAIFALCMLAMLAGCATSQDESIGLPPVSIQQVQYYPYLVKGYQKSFPNKRIVVLAAADSRSFKDSGAGNISHDPYQGHPAIGVIIDRKGQLAQRLYGPDLGPLVQSAIAQAAQEAGMISSTSPQTLPDALHAHGADYVLAST